MPRRKQPEPERKLAYREIKFGCGHTDRVQAPAGVRFAQCPKCYSQSAEYQEQQQEVRLKQFEEIKDGH